jgi:hypothetical protein
MRPLLLLLFLAPGAAAAQYEIAPAPQPRPVLTNLNNGAVSYALTVEGGAGIGETGSASFAALAGSIDADFGETWSVAWLAIWAGWRATVIADPLNGSIYGGLGATIQFLRIAIFSVGAGWRAGHVYGEQTAIGGPSIHVTGRLQAPVYLGRAFDNAVFVGGYVTGVFTWEIERGEQLTDVIGGLHVTVDVDNGPRDAR